MQHIVALLHMHTLTQTDHYALHKQLQYETQQQQLKYGDNNSNNSENITRNHIASTLFVIYSSQFVCILARIMSLFCSPNRICFVLTFRLHFFSFFHGVSPIFTLLLTINPSHFASQSPSSFLFTLKQPHYNSCSIEQFVRVCVCVCSRWSLVNYTSNTNSAALAMTMYNFRMAWIPSKSLVRCWIPMTLIDARSLLLSNCWPRQFEHHKYIVFQCTNGLLVTCQHLKHNKCEAFQIFNVLMTFFLNFGGCRV